MTTRVFTGDCRAILPTLPAASVHACVTSPPYYGLRAYLPDDHPAKAAEIGAASSPAAYVADLVDVFREVRRVLRDDATLWLNLGDSYNGAKSGNTNGGQSSGLRRDGRPEASRQQSNANQSDDFAGMKFRKKLAPGVKPKDLLGIPWRVAFALQDDGWWLRSAIVWHKPNAMPEPVRDRPTAAYEMLFLMAKSERYYYDADAIAEDALGTGGGTVATPDKAARAGITRSGKGAATTLRAKGNVTRNARNVWTIPTAPSSLGHFALMPPALAERCILAGTRPGGTVLDPFGGGGTTALVADRLRRNAVMVELHPDFAAMSGGRITADAGLFAELTA